MIYHAVVSQSDTSEGHPPERPVDVPEGKERSDAVRAFRSVSGEKWLRSRHRSRLCRAHVAKRSVSPTLMPLLVFASKKGIVDAKPVQAPINSALAPVEKEGKSR